MKVSLAMCMKTKGRKNHLRESLAMFMKKKKLWFISGDVYEKKGG